MYDDVKKESRDIRLAKFGYKFKENFLIDEFYSKNNKNT